MGDPGAGPLSTRTERPPCCSLSAFWPVDFLRHFFSQTLGLGTQKERLLDELTLEGVTRYMQSERCKTRACFAPDLLLPRPLEPFAIHTFCWQVTQGAQRTWLITPERGCRPSN